MNWKVKLTIWVFGLFFALSAFMSSDYPDYKGFYISVAILMGLLVMTFWRTKPQFSETDRQKALRDYKERYSWDNIWARIKSDTNKKDQ